MEAPVTTIPVTACSGSDGTTAAATAAAAAPLPPSSGSLPQAGGGDPPEMPAAAKGIESLDYDINATTLFEKDYSKQTHTERRIHITAQWIVCGVCGCLVGLLAFGIDVGSRQLQALKWRAAAAAFAVKHGHADDDPTAAVAWALLTLVAFSAALAMVAASLVLYGEPVAGGSGIPEVKAYLQGCRLRRFLRVTTLACKSVGVLCSVAAGLVCGKEGPMIHAGAIIAGGISQGSSKTLRWRTMLLKRFRNDHDKRDFVSAGAAAGVAAAFGAPIGGVLFALEEAATHWSQSLTWRTFFCALCSTATLNLCLSAIAQDGAIPGHLSHPGLITFGSFLDCQSHEWYNMYELGAFVVIGAASGVIGATFNELNRRLTLWRQAHLRSTRLRLLEAALVASLTAALAITLPLAVRSCTVANATRPAPPAMGAVGGGGDFGGEFGAAASLGAPFGAVGALGEPGEAQLPGAWGAAARDGPRGANGPVCVPPPSNPLQQQMHAVVCGEDVGGPRESAMVRLLLAEHEAGIKALFHLPGASQRDATHGVSPYVCLAFFLFSFGVGVITYGLALPSGLFVPCIMAGGALGRLIGELIGPQLGAASPGNYALMGAAGMLGGICRMTISITVIVIESTGNVIYSIPIAVTIMVSKIVGDLLTAGIYDLHVGLKGYPFLPEGPSDTRAVLQAADVMAKGVRTVCEHEQVATLVKLLRTTPHHGFPVTARGGGGGVIGVILRDQLMTILSRRRFETRRASSPHLGSYFGHQAGPSAGQQPPLTADDFLRPWSDQSIEQLALSLSPEDLSMGVNLRPYVNEAALVTLKSTSLRRVSNLFLTMGLRHLLVVEQNPKVVGVITRKDLLYGGHETLRQIEEQRLRESYLGDDRASGRGASGISLQWLWQSVRSSARRRRRHRSSISKTVERHRTTNGTGGSERNGLSGGSFSGGYTSRGATTSHDPLPGGGVLGGAYAGRATYSGGIGGEPSAPFVRSRAVTSEPALSEPMLCGRDDDDPHAALVGGGVAPLLAPARGRSDTMPMPGTDHGNDSDRGAQ